MKIQKRHLKKFSRLVQELQELLKEVQQYCPEAVYRLNTCESLEFGLNADGDDYPYYISEDLYCDAINDNGLESYCLLSEDEEDELRYSPRKRGSNTVPKTMSYSKSDIKAFYNGYCNSCLGEPLPIKEFAKKYLKVDI